MTRPPDWQPRAVRAVLGGVRTDDWTRVDVAWDRVRGPRGIHYRRDIAADDRGFLREAVLIARGGRFLDDFVMALVASGALDDAVAKAIMKRLGRPQWHLQAFQNGVYLLRDAVLDAEDQRAACDYVCRIDIDGIHRGTGVQVRPTLVATAAHVIWELVATRPDGSPDLAADDALRVAEGSHGRISVTFGDANVRDQDDPRRVHRSAGEVAPVARDWLAWASAPAHADVAGGLQVTDVSDITAADGPWDVALIRLAAPWGKQTARVLDANPPRGSFEVHLLHHPNGNTAKGQPLAISGGALYKHLPRWPPVRCLHNAATSDGSSGAPVFDRSWHVVALHQGGAPPPGASGGDNRAIPVYPWLARVDLAEKAGQADVPYLAWLKTARDLSPCPYPVIGRTETQRRIRQAMLPGATAQQRLLIVRGEPGTGLRFTGRLVKEIVTVHSDGLLAELEVGNAPSDATGIADWIIGALSAGLPARGGLLAKTGDRAVRDDLAPALGQRLDELASGRAVWVVLTGPGDVPGGMPSPVTGIISELIDQLGSYPAVRLVLPGWTQVPEGFAGSVEELGPPTAEDVARHLLPAGEELSPEIVGLVRGPFDFAVSKHGSADYPTARMLAGHLRPLVATIVRGNLNEEADSD